MKNIRYPTPNWTRILAFYHNNTGSMIAKISTKLHSFMWNIMTSRQMPEVHCHLVSDNVTAVNYITNYEPFAIFIYSRSLCVISNITFINFSKATNHFYRKINNFLKWHHLILNLKVCNKKIIDKCNRFLSSLCIYSLFLNYTLNKRYVPDMSMKKQILLWQVSR